MADVKIAYSGTSATTITATGLASLANGAGFQLAIVDNTTNKYMDDLVRIKARGASGGTGTLDVYVFAAAESSSAVYSDGAAATAGTFTVANRLNSPLLVSVQMNAANDVVSPPVSIAALFGGSVPPHWGLIFINNSGAALDGTGGNFSVVYTGIYNSIS